MNRRKIEGLCNAIYAEPQQFTSAEEFARAHHDDVPRLTLEEIDAERLLARFRWAMLVHHGVEPSPWLEERLHYLDEAAQRRRQGARR